MAKDLEDRVDLLFSEWNKPSSPGAAVLLLKDNRVLLKKGYGYANLEHNIAIRTDTVFQAASLSKQFTAMAIEILCCEGKMSINDPVKKFVPNFPDFKHTITVKHLIHHVSGLREEISLLALAGWHPDDVVTNDHILRMINSQKSLDFTPGSAFSYCNSGYTILGQVVQHVAGQPFRDFLETRIFAPLQMSKSQVIHDHQTIIKDRADSYSRVQGGFKKHVLNWAGFGSTNVYTTVEDLGKWLVNLQTGRIGGPVVASKMLETYALNDGRIIDYAHGLIVTKYKGSKLVFHTGTDAGYRNYCGFFPEHQLGFIMLSNTSCIPREKIAIEIADLLLEHVTSPSKQTTLSKPRTILKYVLCPGTYHVQRLGKLLHVEFEEGILTAKLEGWPKSQPLIITGMKKPSPELQQEKEFFDDNVFKTEPCDLTISFHGDETAIRGASVTQGKMTMQAEKIALAPRERDSREYVGQYFSSELQTVYRITVVDDEPELEHKRFGNVPLLSLGRNQFLARWGPLTKIAFTTDKVKRINGFYSSTSGTSNLFFSRIDP